MPTKYELHLSIKETEEVIELSGEISDADCEVFEDFVMYADELHKTELIQLGGWGEERIDFTPNSMKVSTESPHWERVMAFLHRCRPFILQDERTSFYKVCN